MSRPRKTIPQEPASDCHGVQKILLYSASDESIADYSKTLRKFGDAFETVNNITEAKKMLRTRQFDSLIADLTNFEGSGRRLIHWAKAHMPGSFKTHGYMRTDIPNLIKNIYCQGIDQRFYYDHADIDHLTKVIFTISINHPDMTWVRDITVGQKELRRIIGKKSAMECPVLLQGAKGVGKEPLALLVHCMSNRVAYNFLVLDCNPRQKFDYAYRENRDCQSHRQALRANFGALFGEANKGTVYFRSFTHMSPMAQEVLVDVFERGLCRNPETGHMVRFEGRIIFATNKSLPELVSANKVSARLYNLLMNTTMSISPLAKYRDELVTMAKAMVELHCAKGRGKGMTFTSAAEKLIRNYAWPANIEEMSMVMESAISTARMREIGVGDLSLITSEQDDFLKVSLPDTREGLEALIRDHKGCIAKVARACGFSRSMIYKQMNIHGIPVGYK